MKVKKYSASDENQILTAMIVSRPVLAKLASLWTGELFESKWANIVAKFCVVYFRKYDRPPAGAIQPMFEQWAQTADEDTAELVDKFLSQLSDDFKALRKSVNPDFILDLAAIHLNKVSIKRLYQDLEDDVEGNAIDRAQERLTKWKSISVTAEAGIDLFNDSDFIRSAVEAQQESLIKYKGALGTFFGNDLARDCFVALMAPEKTGKTMWLLDMGLRGALQNNKVAFFEVGDMSEKQLARRVVQRFAKKPLYPKEIKLPVSLDWNDDEDDFEVKYKTRNFKEGLTPEEAVEAMERVPDSLKKNFRLSVHANSTLSVNGMSSILETWQREEGWSPDIIVIDYADILAPPPGVADARDQINTTWKQLRSLSQQLHCLVVTATQADADSYNQKLITRKNFTDDKRKMAHVTAMLGINVTPLEKKKRIMRLNWVVLRESEFLETTTVTVAHCLDLAIPSVISAFGR